MIRKLTLFCFAIGVIVGLTKAAPVAEESSLDPAQDDFQKEFQAFQEQSKKQFEDFERRSGFAPLSETDIKSLPKDGNTHVYGESKSYHRSYSNINGKEHEEQGGHKVINDDGKISEYDLA